MKYHIVQINEGIKEIADKYNVSVAEIVKLNRHINNIEHVIPGMKLRIPVLADEVSDSIKESFLDVEKYYPKLEEFKEAELEKKEPVIKTETKVEPIQEFVPQPQVLQQNPYQSQYQYYVPQKPMNYQIPYQQPPQYQIPYQYPQEIQVPYYPYQQPNYQDYFMNMRKKAEEIPVEIEQPKVKIEVPVEKDLYNKPASCNPDLLVEKEVFSDYSNVKFFQNPLYNPPYPCMKIEDFVNNQAAFCEPTIVREIIEEDKVKEIKGDIRDLVKKNTTIRRKKDNLDLL